MVCSSFFLKDNRIFDIITTYNRTESWMRFSDWFPLVLGKRVRLMSITEVLTLLLVIFSALSYIDNHKKK